MPASPADSLLYGRLFSDAGTTRLFTDSAEIRAMLLVEGALARVQGAMGVIPAESAAFIDRASQQVVIDPAALAGATTMNGVPVPALLDAFHKAAGAPDHMQYLHWGATSQDIMDTALALRLRPMLSHWRDYLDAVLARLGVLADETASLPMAARTYGQAATPTSFGAVVASWGWPLLARRGQFVALGDAVLQVSLSGAAGTLSAMGPDGPAVRAALATALGLADPGRSWHSDRSSIGHLAAFAAALAGSLGKLAEDILLMSQSGVAEVSLGGAGGASSTMPQKQNPVGPSVMVALSRHVIGLAALVQGAALHRQQRDGAAWFGEWLSLPQLCICTGRLLSLADQVLSNLTPNAAAMARTLEDGQGLIQAEAISFVLAEYIPRPEAQAIVKQMCAQATATDTALMTLVAQRYPQTDWAARIAGAALGQAPAEAHAFAASLCAE